MEDRAILTGKVFDKEVVYIRHSCVR